MRSRKGNQAQVDDFMRSQGKLATSNLGTRAGAYARQYVGEPVRKAGEALKEKFLDMDEAYANKVATNAGVVDGAPTGKSSAERTLQTLIAGLYGNPLRKIASDERATSAQKRPFYVTNAGARYAMPAAGVGLAAKGISDIMASGEENQTPGTIMPM